MARSLEQRIKLAANDLGFDVCRITSAGLDSKIQHNLQSYVAQHHHGSMSWMVETLERRSDPKNLWPDARSVIILAMNYGPADDPLNNGQSSNRGQISVYAQNRDYHDIVKGKLKTLAGKFVSWCPSDVKVFVDTAPVMEKPLAAKAGVGWQGKHTNLVSRDYGAWLFLGSIFTTADLQADTTEPDHCGNCTSCLDICPTNAFPAPYQIDARRCISYLTIENKGPIPHEFRRAIGNRIYGCDDCLAICPWNKFASIAAEPKLRPRDDLNAPSLAFLAGLDDAQFRKFFSGSPVKRIGRNRFLRNVLIAIGNSGDTNHIEMLIGHLNDLAPLVRSAAIWALRMIADNDRFEKLKSQYFIEEDDNYVTSEWNYDGE